MSRVNLSFCLALLAICAVPPGWALPADRDLPLHISSDSADFDDRSGVATYRGAVDISQGSTRLKADIVTVYTEKKTVTRLVAQGTEREAHYQEVIDAEKPPLHASSLTINYNLITGTVELIRRAKLTQGEDSFVGEYIQYDHKKQTVKAKGQHNGEKGRVKIVIQPNKSS